MPTRLDLMMVVVRDMESSLRFYRDILGLPVAYQSPSWSELGPPEGTHLALHLENPAQGILARPGSTSLGFYIYDVDGFVLNARTRGARVEREPSNEDFGRYAELRDPDGYLIGLCRPKGMPVTEEISATVTPPAARPAFAQGALGATVVPAGASFPKPGGSLQGKTAAPAKKPESPGGNLQSRNAAAPNKGTPPPQTKPGMAVQPQPGAPAQSRPALPVRNGQAVKPSSPAAPPAAKKPAPGSLPAAKKPAPAAKPRSHKKAAPAAKKPAAKKAKPAAAKKGSHKPAAKKPAKRRH